MTTPSISLTVFNYPATGRQCGKVLGRRRPPGRPMGPHTVRASSLGFISLLSSEKVDQLAEPEPASLSRRRVG